MTLSKYLAILIFWFFGKSNHVTINIGMYDNIYISDHPLKLAKSGLNNYKDSCYSSLDSEDPGFQ